MRKLKVFGWFKNRWRFLLAVFAVSGVTAFLLTTQITTLFPNPNQYEIQTIDTLTKTKVWHQPIDAPYLIVARGFDHFTSPLTAVRLTSVLAGVGIILLLSYTFRQWFSDRVAVAGILFIITSSWFLSFSRIGAPFVMSAFWLCLFIAMGTWRTYTVRPLLTDVCIAVAVGLSLYTPLYIWLAVIGILVLSFRRRRNMYIVPRKHQWILPVVLLITVGPLLYIGAKNINIFEVLLGIKSLPVNFPIFMERVLQNFSQIFIRGTVDPSLNLGRLPLLDIFSIVMVVLGFFYFESRIKLRRSQFLFAFGAIALFLISMSEFLLGNLALLFPIVMILAIGGIVQLLQRWLNSFPRNPIARSIGVCLVVIAIGFTSFYHLQRYFVAWANNPDAITAHTPDK